MSIGYGQSTRITSLQTVFRCQGKRCKLVIDNAYILNVISVFAAAKLDLKIKPTNRVKVVLEDDITFIGAHKCKVPIETRIYNDKIECDILPMENTHFVSGCP